MNRAARASLRSLGLTSLACALGACAGQPAYRDLPERRQPDGVAVDPISRFEESARTATPAEGLAVLKSPPDDRVAVKTVLDFLNAMTREDTEGIRREFTSDCQQVDPERGARDNAINAWARRFSRFDYTALDASQLFDEAEFVVARADSIDETWAERAGWPRLAESPEDTDVIVVVPIRAPATRLGRLFGPTMGFLLRRSDARFAIHRIVEDFPVTR